MESWEQLVTIARDASWQSIGALVGVLGIAVAFWIYFRQSHKALSYAVLSRPLVTVAQQISGRVQILLDDKLIDSPNLILVKITNTGNVAIEASDYDQPLIATVHGNIISHFQ